DGAATLKIYSTQVWNNVLSSISYAHDRGMGTTVSQVEPHAYANIGALVGASSWDFSGNTTGNLEVATTTVVNNNETCDFAQCGYNRPGVQLGRQDTFSSPLDKTNDVEELQSNVSDVTIWLRAGALHEGKSGSFGSGESRFCYVTDGSGTRTPAPLWKFSHQ